jgi:hypothetical protein
VTEDDESSVHAEIRCRYNLTSFHRHKARGFVLGSSSRQTARYR